MAGYNDKRGIAYKAAIVQLLSLLLLVGVADARKYLITEPPSKQNFSIPGDTCAPYDSCVVREFFRTCSCDDDCFRYGICCYDAPAFSRMQNWEESFECNSTRLTQAVYMKTTCSPNFYGDERIRLGCEENERGMWDLMSNVPVTSNKTTTTYANWNCAICNGETASDLSFWTVQASCPQVRDKRYGLDYYKTRLSYSAIADRWGVFDGNEFVACGLDFYQPAFLMGRIKYCATNLIDSCPDSWKGDDVREKCYTFYGERRERSSGRFYKNVFCAICNGIDLSDVQCFGRNYKTNQPKGSLRIMRLVYNLNPTVREYFYGQPVCTGGKWFDPFMKVCRTVDCGLVPPRTDKKFCLVSSSTHFAPSVLGLLIAAGVALVRSQF